MPRDDDHFWLDIFKKAPIVAFFLALGGIAGVLIAVGYVANEGHGRGMGRVFQCATIVGGAVGLFVGLVVGVLVDSLIGWLLGKSKK
jgi:Na+-driven multidrug efflux pump